MCDDRILQYAIKILFLIWKEHIILYTVVTMILFSGGSLVYLPFYFIWSNQSEILGLMEKPLLLPAYLDDQTTIYSGFFKRCGTFTHLFNTNYQSCGKIKIVLLYCMLLYCKVWSESVSESPLFGNTFTYNVPRTWFGEMMLLQKIEYKSNQSLLVAYTV
jgi:hypothetical protein